MLECSTSKIRLVLSRWDFWRKWRENPWVSVLFRRCIRFDLLFPYLHAISFFVYARTSLWTYCEPRMHSAKLKLRLERQQKMAAILFLFCSSIFHQFCLFVSLQRKAMEKEKKRLAEMCHTRIAPLFVHVRNRDGCRGSAFMWFLQQFFWFPACCTTSRTRWWTCVRSISTACSRKLSNVTWPLK